MLGRLKSVLSRIPSAFRPHAWDKIEVDSIVHNSAALNSLEEQDRDRFGRSIVRDAVYALKGIEPNPDDALYDAWQSIRNTQEFSTMQQRAQKDRVSLMIQAGVLATLARRALADANPGGLDDPDVEADPQSDPERPSLHELLEAGLSFSDAIQQINAEAEAEELAQALAQAQAGAEDPGDPGDGQLPQIAMPVQAEQMQQGSDSALAHTILAKGLMASLDGKPNERLDAAISLFHVVDAKYYARLLGWADRIVCGETHRIRASGGDLTGYSLDAWSDNVLPEEMLAVAEGQLPALAAVAESSLTVTTHEREDPAGRGPVVVLRDESGSMWVGQREKLDGNATSTNGNHRDALSFEVSLAAVFNKQNRDLISIRWGTETRPPYVYGEPGLNKHLRSFLNSGTDLVSCIQAGIDAAHKYAKAADLLVITDARLGTEVGDAAEFSAKMRKLTQEFRAYGGRVWVLVVGTYSGAGAFLDGWVDGWTSLEKIETSDGLADILRGMTTTGEAKIRRL